MNSKDKKKREECCIGDVVPNEQHVEEYFEGVDAFEHNNLLHPNESLTWMFTNVCPYPSGNSKRKAWIDGFLEARSEHRLGHKL